MLLKTAQTDRKRLPRLLTDRSGLDKAWLLAQAERQI